MPLSTAELSDLQAVAQDLVDFAASLTADPDPNPLQVALDAANATIAQRDAEIVTANAATTALQARIDAAKVKLAEAATADAAEDDGRAGALAELG